MEEIKNTRDDLENNIQDQIEFKHWEEIDKEKDLKEVLEELEDIKDEIPSEEKKTTKKKKFNGWKFLAGTEGILLIVLAATGGVWYLKEKFKSTTTGINAKDPEPTSSISEEKRGVTVRLEEDLVSKVEQISELPSSFSASVTNLFGYEYLCFSNGEFKIYYRNEYEQEDNMQRLGVIIDNGRRLTEFDWYYDLSGKLSLLCPIVGDFLQDGSRQLLFLEGRDSAGSSVKGEENSKVWKLSGSKELPRKLRLVDLKNFQEYESLNLLQAMKNIFSFEFTELGTSQLAEAVMTLIVGEAKYKYAISQETYTNAMYDDEIGLGLEDYFTMEISETSIEISTIAYLSEREYLGELTAKLSLQEGIIGLSGAKYGAYVLPNQEDPGSDGIIIPRTSILSDRVTILGSNKERYLIELSNRVERRSHDFNNFIDDGNGFKAYYENGEKRSICGIDVSKYQGEIDWSKVKQAGVEYAIIRLGFRGMNEGTLEFDPYFEQNMKGAIEAGIPIGIYFFSQAITQEEAKQEAEFVLNAIKEQQITYPIVFDTEVVTTYDARANKLTRQDRTQIAKAFMDEIRIAGYKPMLYANTKWMIMGLDLEQLTEYDKWYAYYGDTITFPYEFQMLQYSDKGSVPGIKGKVDLNVSFIDYSIINN